MSAHGFFPTTHWSLIGRLKDEDEALARRALEDLCALYRYPLYCYIRRRGFEHHDAEDALHDFLAKLVRLESFAEADAQRGHLRSFLSTALQRFLANWHRDHAHEAREISRDADEDVRYQQERFTDDDTPDRVLERKWGYALLDQVLTRLREQYARRGRAAVFEALRPVLATGGTLRGEDTARLAAAAGLSEGALRVALSRLLDDYRTALEAEVLHTVGSAEAVQPEIAQLLQVFSR